MSLQSAPFHHDVAEGPQAQAYWVTADDGVRLRFAHWPLDTEQSPAKGTVLLFPGRTEYVEKYGRAAADFAARGYEMIAIDWRGQGLADRMIEPRYVGYVKTFDDFQRDVATVLAALKELDLPKPWHLLGHSMGGCIGLRALHEGLPVTSASFSAPMWGIGLAPYLRAAAWVVGAVSKPLGVHGRLAPSTSPVTLVLDKPFDDNTLTKDPDMYAYMQRQMTGQPDLALAGPAINWVYEALKECRRLRARPSPDIPCLTFLGTDERIVNTGDVHKRMARWPNGTLDLIEDGEHEVLMEVPKTRNHIFDACAAFYDSHPPHHS